MTIPPSISLPTIKMDGKYLRVYTGAVHLPGQFSGEKYVGQLWLIKCLVRPVFTSAPAPSRSGSLRWLSEPQPPRPVTTCHRTGLWVAAVNLTTWKTLHIIALFVFPLSFFLYLRQAFFSTSPKKLKDEKTQNSRKKLKTQSQNSRFQQIWKKSMLKTREINPKMIGNFDWNGKYMVMNMNCWWKDKFGSKIH